MAYVPTGESAFASVEYIMRDVDFGYLIRYMHSTGASAFFVVVYLHMFRGFAYGSYRKPRELLWLIGMAIYLVLMAEGFFGYLLPWGNMSYWGAQVIVSLIGAIPYFGQDLMEWVRGDFVMSGITLNRFFALHVVALPLALVGLVFLHIVALHHVGSSNPDGIEIKAKKDENGIPLVRHTVPSVLLDERLRSDHRVLDPVLRRLFFTPRRWEVTSSRNQTSKKRIHLKPQSTSLPCGTTHRFMQCCAPLHFRF